MPDLPGQFMPSRIVRQLPSPFHPRFFPPSPLSPLLDRVTDEIDRKLIHIMLSSHEAFTAPPGTSLYGSPYILAIACHFGSYGERHGPRP